MTQPSYITPPTEDWQDFIAWDGDIYDSVFDSDTGYNATQGNSLAPDYHLSESLDSEQPCLESAPPSLVEGVPSLEYTVSEPPSILGESSSFRQMYCTSPSIGNTATSPLDGRYFGSFDECDDALSHVSYPQESPILDTRYERIPDSVPSTGPHGSSTETVFNPYVTGSSHSFSGLDVRASQMLNVGTWADQPQIIEPIAEADEHNTDAIPIYPNPQSSNKLSSSYTRPEVRSRAMAIPQSTRRPASYNAAIAQSHWSHKSPPTLSVSPVLCRRPRNATLSRSNSRTGSRRGVVTPSPTSDGLGWVAYQIDTNTNRLAPTNMEGTQGRTARGRKRGLSAEQRTQAALMRIVGACANCKMRKEKCDPGTPCKSCLYHYKGDLVNHPCRDRVLSDQASAFLSEGLGWHPTARKLESFLAPNSFHIMKDITYSIPLHIGFGPEFSVPVHPIHINSNQQPIHEHSIYPWPPTSSPPTQHHHAVFPAVLTDEATSTLTQTLDAHLSLLVLDHFRHFPLYCSPLRILREIYLYYRSLPPQSAKSQTLHRALKLLVLVHTGGDITLPPSTTHSALAAFPNPLSTDTQTQPQPQPQTPCFIRAQFGTIIPPLSLSLLQPLLSDLQHHLLTHAPSSWPFSLATILLLLMTLESAHYHAAKLPYHHTLVFCNIERTSERHVGREAIEALVAFYKVAFGPCHVAWRAGGGVEGEWEGQGQDAAFLRGVRECLRECGEGYFDDKAREPPGARGMEYFFDRYLVRILSLGR